MRILIYGINFSPELTGGGKYTGEMTAWLVARGHEVRVVTTPPYYPKWHVAEGFSGFRYSYERQAYLAIWRCPLYVPSRPSGIKRLLHLASFALSSFPVMFRQVLWRPDIVWVVEPALMCAPGSWLTARLADAKAWLHVQDFEVDAAFDLGLVRAPLLKKLVLNFERWLMNRFDRVSTISDKMSARLLDKGVVSGKIVLFPNWVDTTVIRPVDHGIASAAHGVTTYRAEWGVPEGTTIVALYSGNMGEKQGLEIVIEAARKLVANQTIHFVLCGNGAAYPRLRRMAVDLPNIIWLPLQPYERLNELLNAADIHLLPQQASAADLVMPSKLTGIFASGRPVVATAEPGTAVFDAVDGRGILVSPGDVNAFVSAVLDLAQNGEMRQRLGIAAREYAIHHLDKEVILKRFEQMLASLN